MEEFVKGAVHEEILSILSLYDADPLLLLSCCKYAKKYLGHNKVIHSQVLLSLKLPKVDNCTKLLSYLGGSSFDKALKQCDKYMNLASKTQDRNKAKTALTDLHNSMMNQLLIAIINLIELICREAAQPGASHVCFKKISDVLNENERERYLFDCFFIPNDDVKLALVNCILCVPLKELDLEEINHLIKVVSDTKNIGAGKAEEIISTIFRIFIKLIIDKDNSASKNFRVKYGKLAISKCLEILLKNQKRKIDEKEEADEKLTLSISCLYFLKEASRADDIKKEMKDVEFAERFSENLLEEQNKAFHAHKTIPIEIEYTVLGNSFDTLKNSLAGSLALEPFTAVSFRVIQQIANVLQNKDGNIELIKRDKKNDIITTDQMREALKRSFVFRIDNELEIWDESYEKKYMSDVDRSKEIKNAMTIEHNSFVKNSGLYLLVLFLTKKKVKRYATGKDDENEKNPLLTHKITDEVHSIFDKHQKEFDKCKQFKKDISRSSNFNVRSSVTNSKDEKSNKEKLILALKKQINDATFYDGPLLTDKSVHFNLSALSYKTTAEENQAAISHDDTVEREINEMVQKIEPATVAAFLRIVYASIIYSPESDYKKKIILQLYDIPILKKITSLCYNTKWTNGNIGLKYLKIVRNAIEQDDLSDTSIKTKGKSKKNNRKKRFDQRLCFYEIISNAIKEILKEVDISFNKKESNKIRKYKREIGLLSEITLCCKLIIERCSVFDLTGSTDQAQDEELFSKDDYHDKYAKAIGQVKTNEKSAYFLRDKDGHREIDIRTPKEKTLDWVISSLIQSKTVMSLIRYSQFNFDLKNDSDDSDMSDDDGNSNEDSSNSDEEEKIPGTNKGKTVYGYPTTRGKAKTRIGATRHGEGKERSGVSNEVRELEKFKSNLTIFIGEYLSKCKASQYEIIETFMRMEVFEGSQIDKNMLKRILEYRKSSKLKYALQNYLKKERKLLCFDTRRLYADGYGTSSGATSTVSGSKASKDRTIDEYIKHFEQKVEVSKDGGSFEPYSLLVSNLGIYIVEQYLDSQCTICPQELLCPDGPKIKYKFVYVGDDSSELSDIQNEVIDNKKHESHDKNSLTYCSNIEINLKEGTPDRMELVIKGISKALYEEWYGHRR